MIQAIKAVFLDVDGVLLPFGEAPDDENEMVGTDDGSTTSGHVIQAAPGRFPEECLDALARILRETGAQIVLSSTWRCAGGAEALVGEFREFSARRKEKSLAAQPCPLGLIAESGFMHMTDPDMHTHRQWEIGAWLEEAASNGITVQSWCALDDEELVSVDPADGGGDFNARWQALFQGRHIKTRSHVGLTDAHASAAIEQLGRPYKQLEPLKAELGKGHAGRKGRGGAKRQTKTLSRQ